MFKKTPHFFSRNTFRNTIKVAFGMGVIAFSSITLSGCNSSDAIAAEPTTFNENSIFGNWGFSAAADIVGNVGGRCPGSTHPQLPTGSTNTAPPCKLVAVGIFSFQANGACTLAARLGVDGLTLPPHPAPPATATLADLTAGQAVSTTGTGSNGGLDGSCAYVVRPDGTGSILENFPNAPGKVILDFVITDQGNEIRFIRRDIVMARGVMKRQ